MQGSVVLAVDCVVALNVQSQHLHPNVTGHVQMAPSAVAVQMAFPLHGLTMHALNVSQLSPMYSGGQLHVYDRTPSTHVPPFRQGLRKQSSTHMHTRSLVGVASFVTSSSAPHAVVTVHVRSVVRVGATLWY